MYFAGTNHVFTTRKLCIFYAYYIFYAYSIVLFVPRVIYLGDPFNLVAGNHRPLFNCRRGSLKYTLALI